MSAGLHIGSRWEERWSVQEIHVYSAVNHFVFHPTQLSTRIGCDDSRIQCDVVSKIVMFSSCLNHLVGQTNGLVACMVLVRFELVEGYAQETIAQWIASRLGRFALNSTLRI